MTTEAERFRAQLYTSLHRGVPGDIEFYRQGCAGQSALLEFGVGDARVLCELQAPVRVGIDVDEAMLELARARRSEPSIELLAGDMASPNVRGSFDRVLIPFNGLLCLSPPEKLACLTHARRLLNPGGRLLLDVYFADELHADAGEVSAEPEVDEEEFLVQLSSAEQQWNVFEQNVWWPSERRIQANYRFESMGLSEEFASSICHHYLLEAELGGLLSAAGFSDFALSTFNKRVGQVGISAW